MAINPINVLIILVVFRMPNQNGLHCTLVFSLCALRSIKEDLRDFCNRTSSILSSEKKNRKI